MLNDPNRLAALAETGLIDAAAQESLDRFTRIAQQALGVPVVLVSLVDGHRQFFASQLGLPDPWAKRRQTPLSHSFCQHVVTDEAELIVTDARRNPRVSDNLAVRDLGVIAYAGFPIRGNDELVLGSFCAIDRDTREWTDRELSILSDLAASVSKEIELRRSAARANAAEANLSRITDELLLDRTQSVSSTASFAHDIRSPLQVIGLGVVTLMKHPAARQSPEVTRALEIMQRNVSHAQSMLALMQVEPRQAALDLLPEDLQPLHAIVTMVCADFAQSGPGPKVELGRNDSAEVRADATNLRRCVENLVTNARRFALSRILVGVTRYPDHIVLSVDDDGTGLPDEKAYRDVWNAGIRFHEAEGRSGTGLGLNIVQIIVEQAGGRVSAAPSVLGGARFELIFPAPI
ncbi:MAG: GAF domain-containing sensor histidine kinase [Steroidobacteraceae bacterium]